MKKAKKIITGIFLTVFLIFTLSFSISSNDLTKTNEYLRSVSSTEEAIEIANKYDLTLLEVISNHLAVYEDENQNSAFLFSEGFLPNTILSSTGPSWKTPVDPYLDQELNLELTDVPDAWSYTTGSADVTIAIIDTGIDTSHEEFIGRISSLSYNTVTNVSGLSAVVDDYGHGTMVAGVIGANKDNYKGIAGVTQNTVLLVIKSNTPNEGSFKDADIIEGIYYAVDHGADIINLSLGSTYANPLTQEAINYAFENGVLVVGAAGNDGTDDFMYPASFDHVISVSALENDLSLADYSSYGEKVDLSAPGSDVITTAIGGSYASVSGTSFAAPLVSGILGLYISLYPDASVDEVTLKILSGSVDDGEDGWDQYYGYGVVNALNLVTNHFYQVDLVNTPGIGMDVAYVLWGDTLSDITLPTLANQIFVGYYLDPQYNTAYSLDEVVTSDMTLYAKYSDAFHTVTLMEGSVILDQYVAEHDSIVTLPTLSKEGYRFLGWFLDEIGTTIYESSSLMEDLTVYAIFEEIPVYQINYVVFGEIIHESSIPEEQILEEYQYDITGYDFFGWYLDDQFTQEFNQTTVSSNLTVYGKYEIRQLSITYMLDDSVLNEQIVSYGDTPMLWDSALTDFAGWYLDLSFTAPYEFGPLTQDLTLYAKISSGSIKITLIVDGEYAFDLFFEESQEITLDSLEWDGKIFHGWYLDSTYLVQADPSSFLTDTTVYGYFEDVLYVVNYYSYDGTTLIYHLEATYGTLINVPQSAEKPSDTYFDYVFFGWSETLTQVTKDANVYPLFESVFKQESIWLLPGVDTIPAGDDWTDGGISSIGDDFSLSISNPVTSDIEGTYRVEYSILLGEEVVGTLIRVVHVLEKPADIVITLKPGIDTIVMGEEFVDAGATTNVGTIEVISNVDTSSAGEYTVTYHVEVAGYVKEVIRYVNVLTAQESSPALSVQIWKEEEILCVK